MFPVPGEDYPLIVAEELFDPAGHAGVHGHQGACGGRNIAIPHPAKRPASQSLMSTPIVPNAEQARPQAAPCCPHPARLSSHLPASVPQIGSPGPLTPKSTRLWPTWEVAPVGNSPVSGRMEAVVVPRGQVDDTVVELVPFSSDQLIPEGAAGGGCGGQTQGPGSQIST